MVPTHLTNHQVFPIQAVAPADYTHAPDLSIATNMVEVLLMHVASEPNRPHIFLQNEKREEQLVLWRIGYEQPMNRLGLVNHGIVPGEKCDAIMLDLSILLCFFLAYC